MSLKYEIVHCVCKRCGKEFDIKRYSNYNGNDYIKSFCSTHCKREHAWLNPIFVKSEEDLLDIIKQHPKGLLFISYRCKKCGKLETKEIRDKNKDYELLCKSCLSTYVQSQFSSDKKTQIIEKKNNTIIKKYGSFENFEALIRTKVENTCLAKYGVKNSFCVEEFKNKAKQTYLKKYGTTNYAKTKEFKEKFEKTMLNKYGVKYTLQSNELRQKGIDTRIKNEGIYYKQNDVAKCKNTKLMRYGNESYNNSEQHRSTCKKRYGVSSYSQTREFQEKRYKHYCYDNAYFDSSWELAVWIYCKDHNIDIEREPTYFDYMYDNKTYRYYPDFLIENQLVEIKGDHLMKAMLEDVNSLDHSKYQCMLENNIKVMTKKDVSLYLKYVKDTYGKNYLREFRLI